MRIELTITEHKAYYYGYEINYNQTKQQNVPYKLNKLKQEIPIRNWFLEKKKPKTFYYNLKNKNKKKRIKMAENRDPNSMNSYIQVSFDDVLAEPEGAHSADW